MRLRLALILTAVVLLGTALLTPLLYARFSGPSTLPPDRQRAPSVQPTPKPPAGPVRINVPDGFVSWALMDRTTGAISASANATAISSIESVVKVWIVADFLRRTDESGGVPSQAQLSLASAAIRDSDDGAAQALYAAGGYDSVIVRMVTICRLTDTTPYSGWWSQTQMSADDAVRLGDCVGDGRAAGPHWTLWVLNEMAQVRGGTAPQDQHATSGGGRWGIIDGLPPQVVGEGVGIKNGWTRNWTDGAWHVNCLAVAPEWALAVLIRYPASRSLEYGAEVCRSVAAQLVDRGAID